MKTNGRKKLWDEINRLCTTSKSQAVIKLEHGLEEILFVENDSWETLLGKLQELLGKVSSYDLPVKGDEESKNDRTELD